MPFAGSRQRRTETGLECHLLAGAQCPPAPAVPDAPASSGQLSILISTGRPAFLPPWTLTLGDQLNGHVSIAHVLIHFGQAKHALEVVGLILDDYENLFSFANSLLECAPLLTSLEPLLCTIVVVEAHVAHCRPLVVANNSLGVLAIILAALPRLNDIGGDVESIIVP